jgi:hypothetical protein
VCSAAQAFFWDVLLPTGNIMLGWNIIMLLLLTYLATVLPYAVAFDIDLVSCMVSAAAQYDVCRDRMIVLCAASMLPTATFMAHPTAGLVKCVLKTCCCSAACRVTCQTHYQLWTLLST